MDPFIQAQNWFPESDHWEIIENTTGHSSSRVFMISQHETNKWVLKAEPLADTSNLLREKENLDWLSSKLPVPKAEWYRRENGWEWLLMEYLPGSASYAYKPKGDVGKLLGESLKAFHQLNSKGMSNTSNQTEVVLGKLESEFSTEYVGIKTLLPQAWDLVVSHGDYCLPNVFLQDGGLAGYIDVGTLGVYDRYHEIYLCLWSLKYNKLEEESDNFLKAYGISQLDQDKMKIMSTLQHYGFI